MAIVPFICLRQIIFITKLAVLPRVRDKWFRLLAVLLPFLVIAYVNGLLAGITREKLTNTLVSLVAIIMICEGARLIVYKGHRSFPRRYRLALMFIIGLLWTAVWLSFSSIARHYINTGVVDFAQMKDSNIVINDRKLIIGVFTYSLVNSVINFSALLVMYQVLYHQAKLKYTEEEKEKLEKEKLKAELLQLKGIVNPHFLFNNLNSLSSLISENPAKAQEFLDELTQVFRYLLRNNQTELTTLSEELKFIQTYYQLLRTRYGSGIEMKLEIDNDYHNLLIPPLTLQLLVENAVKHNKVHKDYPLYIELQAVPGKKLIVRNTVSRKEGRIESTGIGLQTINSRYRMLNKEGVLIQQTGKMFSVVIPLVDEPLPEHRSII